MIVTESFEDQHGLTFQGLLDPRYTYHGIKRPELSTPRSLNPRPPTASLDITEDVLCPRFGAGKLETYTDKT